MTTGKVTFLPVFHKYLIYAEAFSQYNRLNEEDDKKIIKPYIDRLKQQWQEELIGIRFKVTSSLPLHNHKRVP